jgi:hypothetical protein
MYVRELQQSGAATMTRDLVELFMQQVTRIVQRVARDFLVQHAHYHL